MKAFLAATEMPIRHSTAVLLAASFGCLLLLAGMCLWKSIRQTKSLKGLFAFVAACACVTVYVVHSLIPNWDGVRHFFNYVVNP